MLIAPLLVCFQTLDKAKELGYNATFCYKQDDIINGINILNCEKLENFDCSGIKAVALDESSILKSFTGTYRNLLVNKFKNTDYKFCFTATPSPNDDVELTNHADFLDVMKPKQILSLFFINDTKIQMGSKWRLKKHAVNDYYNFLASWAVFMTKPSDLGYSDEGFILPKLDINHHLIKSKVPIGQLFVMEAKSLDERRKAKRDSLVDRCQKAKELVDLKDEQFLIWCELNDEAAELKKILDNDVEISGSDNDNEKITKLNKFKNGEVKILITKPKIGAMGLNLQNCHNVIYVGLSDSFEQYYQSIRRCYRYGQKHDVNVGIISSEAEGAMLKNIQRKEHQFKELVNNLILLTKDSIIGNLKNNKCDTKNEYNPQVSMVLPEWLEGAS